VDTSDSINQQLQSCWHVQLGLSGDDSLITREWIARVNTARHKIGRICGPKWSDVPGWQRCGIYVTKPGYSVRVTYREYFS